MSRAAGGKDVGRGATSNIIQGGKVRKFTLFVLVAAIVPVGVAVAESTGLKVTGGGQVLTATGNGAGNTIAFNAQQTAPADENTGEAPAKGQLQVINREAGTGQSQEKFHGDVTCIREFTPQSGPNQGQRFVRFGGFQQVRGQNTDVPFTVDVQDNGEPNMGQDMIFFRQRQSGEDPCDTSDQNTDLSNSSLARGNVQEH